MEKNQLMFANQKFRILAAEANLQAGCITQAINALEHKVEEQEIYSLDYNNNGDAGLSENENLLGHSSGFGIGSSSNQSYTNIININDLVDDMVQDQEANNIFGRNNVGSLRQGGNRNLKKPFFLY